MQTTPTATTAATGQAPQPNGAAKAGDGSIFAALIQALTGTAVAAPAPVARHPATLRPIATASPAEGETVEGGDAIDMAATAQLAGMALPLPPPAAPVLPQAADAAGATAPQPAAHAPGTPPLPAAPSASAAEPQPVLPPSAQAVELAKVLGAGTQVHVTGEAGVPTPPPAPAATAVAVAAGAAGRAGSSRRRAAHPHHRARAEEGVARHYCS